MQADRVVQAGQQTNWVLMAEGSSVLALIRLYCDAGFLVQFEFIFEAVRVIHVTFPC